LSFVQGVIDIILIYFKPAHAHGVADHQIQHQVVVEAHLGVGIHEGDQGHQRFDAGGAAAVAVAGGILLGIRLRFHKYAPQQLAIGLAFHQQAADELGGNDFGGRGEEGR